MNALFIRKAAGALVQLFFPRQCVVCNRVLSGDERHFCLSCRQQLPYTYSWERSFNPALEKFTGRIPVKEAHALLYFTHHGVAQKLIHQIKYNGRKDLAIALGSLLGRYLYAHPAIATADYLVPVPLHFKKERQRGYNQSEEICRGLSQTMRIPLLKNHLIKIKNTATQTHLTTTERLENVRDAYALQHPVPLKNKHLLLVDDVLTTGATLESCARVALQTTGVTISIVTLAVATD